MKGKLFSFTALLSLLFFVGTVVLWVLGYNVAHAIGGTTPGSIYFLNVSRGRMGVAGGSLTILATCLIDTGSRMDQVIFEEFKGTGNMELTLERGLANQRIFPALDIAQSGTRKEEKLLDARQLAAARNLRRHLMNMPPAQAMKNLLEVLGKHKTNESLFNSIRV